MGSFRQKLREFIANRFAIYEMTKDVPQAERKLYQVEIGAWISPDVTW